MSELRIINNLEIIDEIDNVALKGKLKCNCGCNGDCKCSEKEELESVKNTDCCGCSADCEMMYQIGVDVLPEYRRKGIASALTSRLALEILALDKVPFYCAAWSNIKSVRNAIRCGFRPAWVQLTAESVEFIDSTNGK